MAIPQGANSKIIGVKWNAAKYAFGMNIGVNPVDNILGTGSTATLSVKDVDNQITKNVPIGSRQDSDAFSIIQPDDPGTFNSTGCGTRPADIWTWLRDLFDPKPRKADPPYKRSKRYEFTMTLNWNIPVGTFKKSHVTVHSFINDKDGVNLKDFETTDDNFGGFSKTYDVDLIAPTVQNKDWDISLP